jgi:hemerythrin-like domain-containing protein
MLQPREPVPAMSAGISVFEPFRADHVRVLAQLDALEESVGSGGPLAPAAEHELRETLDLLHRQFATHVTVEERVLYPALVEAFPGAGPSLEPLQAEHTEMRAMVLRLAGVLEQAPSRARDEQLVVQARDLVDLLRLHIRKEELAVFNVAARVLTAPELAKLAERVAGHRGTIDPDTGPTAGKGTPS